MAQDRLLKGLRAVPALAPSRMAITRRSYCDVRLILELLAVQTPPGA